MAIDYEELLRKVVLMVVREQECDTFYPDSLVFAGLTPDEQDAVIRMDKQADDIIAEEADIKYKARQKKKAEEAVKAGAVWIPQSEAKMPQILSSFAEESRDGVTYLLVTP